MELCLENPPTHPEKRVLLACLLTCVISRIMWQWMDGWTDERVNKTAPSFLFSLQFEANTAMALYSSEGQPTCVNIARSSALHWEGIRFPRKQEPAAECCLPTSNGERMGQTFNTKFHSRSFHNTDFRVNLAFPAGP